MPESIVPMIAKSSGDVPSGPDWAAEIMWDGVRALAYCGDGELRLQGLAGEDITGLFPEIEGLGRVPRAQGTILDGELVSFDERGIPSFGEVQDRLRPPRDPKAPRTFRSYVATFIIFDIVWDRGTDMRAKPYRDRREVLERMGLKGKTWRVPDYLIADIPSTLEATAQQGLEGLILKRLDSPYVGDGGHAAWLDLKIHSRQEFVVGGWRRHGAEGEHSDGGLYLGFWDKKEGDGQVLRFAGMVSAGFSQGDLESIEKDLENFERGSTPFDDMDDSEEIQFVNPKRVVEVEFEGWSEEGRLREPVYVGMRRDRDPGETRRDPT